MNPPAQLFFDAGAMPAERPTTAPKRVYLFKTCFLILFVVYFIFQSTYNLLSKIIEDVEMRKILYSFKFFNINDTLSNKSGITF